MRLPKWVSWFHARGTGLSGIGLALATGCPVQPTTAPDEVPVASDDDPTGPLIPTEPANRAVGDELEATLSIAGGGAIQLSSFRGRPVLLEISVSEEPGFVEAHAFYAELLAAHPELAVIIVLTEPDDGALLGLPAEFTPAWDPAGALAAKLSVATFPTIFVIDRHGRIGEVVNGWSDNVRERLRTAVKGI